MKGIYCPVCNTDKHDPRYEKDGLYVCNTCGKVLGYLCKGCDQIYLENRLTEYSNVWICKECNTVQWGYTEYKNKKGVER